MRVLPFERGVGQDWPTLRNGAFVFAAKAIQQREGGGPRPLRSKPLGRTLTASSRLFSAAPTGRALGAEAGRVGWYFGALSVSPLGREFSSSTPPPSVRAERPSLLIGRADDPLEREAEAISGQVARARARPVCEAAEALRISRQSAGEAPVMQVRTASAGEAPGVVHEALRSPGQPLDSATRAFLEPRFRHDFGDVRVHTDAVAARSADAVHARAYTVGRDIVFARGRYTPHTAPGERLLTHELAHVVQQHGARQTSMVRRSEVDDRTCGSLTDSEADIDTFVNKEIDEARKTMSGPLFAPLLALRVMERLGGRSPVSPIETFIESLPATKRMLPPDDLVGTKYSGVGSVNKFYALQAMGVAHVVGSVTKVHGICVGADKLGHFFDQGFDFLEAANKPGSKAQDITNLGLEMEIGAFGLGSTGVFSNADLAANSAGMQFYKDLERSPGKFDFHIRKYITAKWNEQANPSFYESSVGSVVWSNLLSGPWTGTFIARVSHTPVGAKFDLLATTSGTVAGSFELMAQVAAGSSREVSIKNGKVTQKTTSLSTIGGAGPPTTATPVSGVSIEFDWDRGAMAGKGRMDSVNEQTLVGTLGTGSSATDSGSFKLRRA